MKKIIIATCLLFTVFFTGCVARNTHISKKANDTVTTPIDFNKYDDNSDGVVDQEEFPKHIRNYDPTIAGHVMMIIITSVCILTFGLVIMTCSREKAKKNT